MHDRAMPDRDAPPDRARHAGIDVDDRAVLHVAVLADHDRIVVAAQHGGGPHAHARAEGDVADDVRGGVDVGGGVDVHRASDA